MFVHFDLAGSDHCVMNLRENLRHWFLRAGCIADPVIVHRIPERMTSLEHPAKPASCHLMLINCRSGPDWFPAVLSRLPSCASVLVRNKTRAGSHHFRLLTFLCITN